MRKLTRRQKWLYAASAVCLALSIFYKFVPVGYHITAMMFLGFAAWLALFALFSAPTRAGRVMRVLLVLGVAVGFPLFLAAEIPVLMDAHSDADTSAPYLIVCGAGVNGSTPSRSMTDRLHQALEWMDQNPDSAVILSGGQGPGEDLSEAQAMYDWLTAQGADPDRLLLEDRSASSYENLQNSLALIGERGGDPAGRVAILSSEYHLHRLGWLAERLGCRPVLVAAPTTKVSLFINYAIREALAMWKMWVFGP